MAENIMAHLEAADASLTRLAVEWNHSVHPDEFDKDDLDILKDALIIIKMRINFHHQMRRQSESDHD